MTGEEGTKVVNSTTDAVNSSSNGQSQSSKATVDSSSALALNIKDKNSNNIGESRSVDQFSSGNGGGGGGGGSVDDSQCPPILPVHELPSLSKEQLTQAYQDLVGYAETLKKDNTQLREAEDKLRIQQVETSRRENVLVMRLTTKEQELQHYVSQLNELKSTVAPTPTSLRSTLLDPAVNLMIQRMKKELEETKKKLEDTQNDLNAWKFTPDSNTGKRLMAKCRMLYQENEDLGKMITGGKLAKLESDLALQRSLTEEMKKSQSELDELIQELDEDVEGMQGTIYYLQQQLRNSKSDCNAPTTSTNSNSLQSSTTPTTIASSTSTTIPFQNEVVTLSVKITDLCAQCQVTHQQKQDSSHTHPVKMEVDPENSVEPHTNDVNTNERTFLNGENSNSSSHSDSHFRPRTAVTKATPLISVSHPSSPNSSDSNIVSESRHEENDEAEELSDQEDNALPPSNKRTKLGAVAAAVSATVAPPDFQKLLQKSNTTSVDSANAPSANRNGSIDHELL